MQDTHKNSPARRVKRVGVPDSRTPTPTPTPTPSSQCRTGAIDKIRPTRPTRPVKNMGVPDCPLIALQIALPD